ncbi:hypothetical protein [Mesorhizobium sp.]|uniref:hypothetical protein n=1 Tax=Mesorhizobium sp. TaxID=1871066 RepID=UPI0025DA3A71|nr:hypothetical protein [Mesorhizobium sp.]
MNAAQLKRAQRAVDNCARMGLPFELAAWMVASWFKDNGIKVTEQNLELAFAHLS